MQAIRGNFFESVMFIRYPVGAKQGDVVMGLGEGANAQSKNAVPFKVLGIADAKSENPLISTAWTVLEAANDLGDARTIEACQRVIDAKLSGALPERSDINIVFDFFN
jgi:hypothetical protein